MRNLFLIHILFLILLHPLKTEVTISNGATSGMVYIGSIWEPTSPIANLNVGDLIATLALGHVIVRDFTPTVCVGPLIVNDPVLYNSSFSLSLESCINVLVYRHVENSGSGNINMSTSAIGAGSGYVVIGTDINAVPLITNGQYAVPIGPAPLISSSVHIGSWTGTTQINAAYLVALLADSGNNQYAQLGLPIAGTTGQIFSFSGQSYAIASNNALGSYARIGNGHPSFSHAIGGNIDVINENGNLFLRSLTSFMDAYASIGHITSSNDISGHISVVIDGSPGNGNILGEATDGAPASIGHLLNSGFGHIVRGPITVQARNNQSYQGGNCTSCYMNIGHTAPDMNIVQDDILVENEGFLTLRSGTNSLCRIGHSGGQSVGNITIGSGLDISVLGESMNSMAQIGHNSTSCDGVIDISCATNVFLQGGNSGSSTLGHIGSGPASPCSGDIFMKVGSLSLEDGTGIGATSTLGHLSNIKMGQINIISGGGVSIFNSVAGNKSIITSFDDINIVAGDKIIIEATAGQSSIITEMGSISLHSLNEIAEESSVSGTTTVEPATFLSIKSGEDIFINEGFFPANGFQLNSIDLEADREWLTGELWAPQAYSSLFLSNIFVPGPLSTNSQAKVPDGAGAISFTHTNPFFPTCIDLTLLSSAHVERSGLPADLHMGTNQRIDLNQVVGNVTIGDVPTAVTTSDAFAQSYSNIFLVQADFNGLELFIKSLDDLSIENSDLNAGGYITIASDNRFPFAPMLGTSNLVINNSALSTPGSHQIRIYSASRNSNTISNSTFNGASFTPCANPCATEDWVSYYNGGTTPQAGGYSFYYKETPVVLAFDGYKAGIDCVRNYFNITNDNPQIRNFQLFGYSFDDRWSKIHQNDAFIGTNVFLLDNGSMQKYSAFKLIAIDDNEYVLDETILKNVCTDNFETSIYPNPVKDILFIESNLNGQVKVINTMGQIIQLNKIEQGINTLDVSSLPCGQYLIKINSQLIKCFVKF